MAPKPLFGRYKLYKAGTNKLIQWLASSASRCCELKSIVKSLGSSLKAKTTKKNKEPTSPVEIRTQEILKLAEAIAAADPPIDIPETIIEIAKDVIAGREECAGWYAAQALQGGSELEQENESHRYFILVLQRVLNLLIDAHGKRPSPEPSVKVKPKDKPEVSRASPSELNNLFACLDIEEPSPTPLGERPPSGTSQSRTPKHFKLENEDEDLAFPTWCFLQDLNDVRTFVQGTWLEYSRGEFSFLAASSITDTAFGLLRCTDEEFSKSNSQTTDWSPLLQYFGLEFFVRERALWVCPRVAGSQPRIPNSKINVVELLCPIAHLCLLSYSLDATALCEDSKLRDSEPHASKDVKPSGYYHYHHFCSVLYRLAPELHHMAHTTQCEHVMVEEFVQGLVQVHRTGKSPMWLVVACQIYLDIYDLLGNYIDHGADALQETFQKHKQVAAEVDEYRAQCSDGMDEVQDAIAQLQWVATTTARFENPNWQPPKDANGRTSAKHLKGKDKIGSTVSAMERSLPAHAGSILTDLKIGMLDVGTKIANYHYHVLSAAHLYKALRGLGLLKADWHDMDFVLAAFGTKRPLVAKSPPHPDPEAAFRRYLLALGIPASDFAVGGRRVSVGSMSALKEARKITITSPFLQGMRSRQTDWNDHGLGYTSKHKTVEVVLQTLATNAAVADSGAKRNRRNSQMQASFTPVQLLTRFRKSILADEPQLNFDYTSFTLSCARLLQIVSDQAGPQLQLGDQHTSDWHLSLVAALLRSRSSQPAVAMAANILQSHIISTGKTFVKQAYDQSSGRIPKHLRPNIAQDLADKEVMQVMMRTMFDYADTKYSFSGRSMAAYHPGIISECCNGDGIGHGGETDPSKHSPGRRHECPPLFAFGSAVPRAILDQGLANAQSDPTKFHAARYKLVDQLFKNHQNGKMTEEKLRQSVNDVLGFQLVTVDIAPRGVIPWAYLVVPGHEQYRKVYEVLRWGGFRGEYGCPIAVPVDKSLEGSPVAYTKGDWGSAVAVA